jgi:hypothetical protein
LQRDETHAWNVVMMTLGLAVTPCNAEWRWLLDRDDSSWVCRDAAVSPVAGGQLARGFFRIADAVRACAAQAK